MTKDLREPYRMLTSRSEYRLVLRSDNADARLTELGRAWSIVPDEPWERFTAKMARIGNERSRLATTRVKPDSPVAVAACDLSGQGTSAPMLSLEEILRRPHVHYATLEAHGYGCSGGDDGDGTGEGTGTSSSSSTTTNYNYLSKLEKEAVEIQVKYAGFISRQEKQLEGMKRRENKVIPDWLEYDDVATMSLEAREKLNKMRPTTIGQAWRVGGVSPADISSLLVHLEVERRRRMGEREGQGQGQGDGQGQREEDRVRRVPEEEGRGGEKMKETAAESVDRRLDDLIDEHAWQPPKSRKQRREEALARAETKRM